MRLIMIAVGSIGDVFPLLGIAREMRTRGHAVQVIANPFYAKHVEQVGAELLPIGTAEEHQQMMSHPSITHPRKGWALWLKLGSLNYLKQTYALIEEHAVKGETVLAGSWGAQAALVAREKLGIPAATLHLEPDKFRTAFDSAAMPRRSLVFQSNPAWLKRMQYRLLDKLLIDPAFEPVNAFRRELALPEIQHFWNAGIHSPDLTVGLFPDWWGPLQPDWPQQTKLIGFPLWDQNPDQQFPEEVAEFLDAGEPPVVFSPGGFGNIPEKLFKIVVPVCEELGLRAILLTSNRSLLPKQLPETIGHFQFIPFTPLLNRAAAVVHHAGIGTAALCLAAGTPQIAIPPMHINRDTALRLERLGVGRMISPFSLREESLKQSLRVLLGADTINSNCQEIASRLENSSTIPTAADLLESLVPKA
ncbi:MurG-like transferase [Gimesia alba]|uniref:MurG-like transferase n=1 Tax=Gimesia alba TaxID=2527973 RepID=A0A517RA40_9PLAN|nr:nucleotide disphospho-sugar-binding domain-containing protein [Gimesia alba]QDT40728.1 MurG-like transferase [Gimesia alba]